MPKTRVVLLQSGKVAIANKVMIQATFIGSYTKRAACRDHKALIREKSRARETFF